MWVCIMDSVLLLVTLLIIITYLIYSLVHVKFNYWKKKNVPFEKPLPFIGNYGKYIFLQEYAGYLVQKLCQKFPDAPYFGAFFGTEPVLIVQSPEILKHILTKDFYKFNGREITKYETRESFTQNLFFSGGNTWKIARQNLTPLFSSTKIKNMFYLVEKCCHMFEDVLDLEESSNIVEVRHLSTRYTIDAIGSCAFGVEPNTLLYAVNNPFSILAKEIIKSTTYRGFLIVFRALWPAIFYGLRFKCLPTTIDTFFKQLLKNVFETRKYLPSGRNDFVDILLKLKENDVITGDSIDNVKTGRDDKVQLKVDDNFLISQCVVFFTAGFDTSASILSFTLYEMAKHPRVQTLAMKEIDEFLRHKGNKLTYDCVTDLLYLNACIHETIRKYPVLGNITREVMDDCVLPDGLHLNKGVRIHIPVYHLHHNPNYFPEPEVYSPERFLPENRENIKPYTYLPFGEGPRNCIGKRFGVMQVIAGLITFMKQYRVELAEDMPDTVTLGALTFTTQPVKDQGLMLKLFKREGWENRKFLRT